MSEQEIVEIKTDEVTSPDYEVSESKGVVLWHYIKTFVSFFALVSAGGLLLETFYTNSSVRILFEIMMGIGTVCALVAIKDIFIFVHHIAKIVSAFFGTVSFLLLIPFVPILFSVMSYVAFFGLGIMLCALFPYVMTLISYFKNTIWETFDKKKEILVAASGVLCAIIILAGVFVVHKSVSAIGASSLKDELNTQQLYSEYINKYPDEEIKGLDFDNPTTSTFDIDNKEQIDVYDFEQNINGAVFDCLVTIKYKHHNDGWSTSIEVQRNFKNYTLDVSGTYKGVGYFSGNMMTSKNNYTLIIDKLTKEGGTGTMSIVDRTFLNESQKFTMTITEVSEGTDDVILKINVDFYEPLCDGTKSTTCTYSVINGEFIFSELGYEDVIIGAPAKLDTQESH